jgi:hypothetical protein
MGLLRKQNGDVRRRLKQISHRREKGLGELGFGLRFFLL